MGDRKLVGNDKSGLGSDFTKEWHPSKNGDLTPFDVSPFSHRMIWWRCEKGHEWKADVRSRTSGKGCPYCAGQMAGAENNLAYLYPDVAKEWHPTRNGNFSPDEVTPGSNKKVWWKCDRGHEWTATVFSRKYGSRCPACSGRKVSADNSLAAKFPELSRQWNEKKNLSLSPSDVLPGSNQKVWWKCAKGHEWRAVVGFRSQGSGCPFCAGKKVGEDNNLAELRADLASQWHPTRNGTLTSKDVTPGSGRKVWWRCDNGHEWVALVSSRTRGTGCPFCAGVRIGEDNNLAAVMPQLVSEWNAKKNGQLSPTEVGPGSNKKVWWRCGKGHEWKAAIKDRARGTGCPYCAGKKVTEENNLQVMFPELAKEWHPTKNGSLKPSEVKPRSALRVWWRCERGHEWRTSVGSRVDGAGCPLCRKTGR